MKQGFRKVANKISAVTGTAGAFIFAFSVIVVWGLSGSYFNYSDTWQLVINTGTTIITFLMVFLIQNTQNRDGKAVQLKLDELIHSSRTARNTFMGLEDLTDEELLALDVEFKKLHDGQKASPTLHKLHSKIEAEHNRRLTLGQQATQVLSMFDPRKISLSVNDADASKHDSLKNSSSQKR